MYMIKSLDKISMNVIETSGNGVVNEETIFQFLQKGKKVFAKYEGGKIKRGRLVGSLIKNVLTFNYFQEQIGGKLDYGYSTCELTLSSSGKIRLIENFNWASRKDSDGVNIFEKI